MIQHLKASALLAAIGGFLALSIYAPWLPVTLLVIVLAVLVYGLAYAAFSADEGDTHGV
ncbi:hypothetical protein [Sphingomonas asaccharolytica]|uniref:hypothetical protein n=1 Tax=Sphingomonas asaccharolytica TaxID=40681 RepID=UPI000A58C464|nr:hypothetical protein [Sphingomonas asaccharolytica]